MIFTCSGRKGWEVKEVLENVGNCGNGGGLKFRGGETA